MRNQVLVVVLTLVTQRFSTVIIESKVKKQNCLLTTSEVKSKINPAIIKINTLRNLPKGCVMVDCPLLHLFIHFLSAINLMVPATLISIN